MECSASSLHQLRSTPLTSFGTRLGTHVHQDDGCVSLETCAQVGRQSQAGRGRRCVHFHLQMKWTWTQGAWPGVGLHCMGCTAWAGPHPPLTLGELSHALPAGKELPGGWGATQGSGRTSPGGQGLRQKFSILGSGTDTLNKAWRPHSGLPSSEALTFLV